MAGDLSIIQMNGIHKEYVSNKLCTKVLHNINISIDKGEFISIEGPSGCGKSTLMAIMGLIESPTSGSYYFNGTDISQLSQTQLSSIRNHEIGFIFQNFNLIDDLTIKENVEIPLRYQNLTKSERNTRTVNALEQVKMSHRMNYYPSQLSGGQQQRVAVARAIINQPFILLADEPTGNLDSTNGEIIMNILNTLHQEGSTICMVTHNAQYAQKAQRTINMLDGHILETDTPNDSNDFHECMGKTTLLPLLHM
jgi:putative ABC transport system ATP-binding protein